MTTPSRTTAALMLRQVATDDQPSNGTRLHCLRAAELLDPRTPLPAAEPNLADSATTIHDALRLLAALPQHEFGEQVRLAAHHARRALLDLELIDGDGDVAG